MPKNYSVGIVHSGGKPFGVEGPNTAWGSWGAQFLAGKTPTPTTDVTWGDSSVFCGPATTMTGPLGVKQVHGTVPIRYRGCTGCHEGHNSTPVIQPVATRAVPDTMEAPPWDVRSLSYVQDVQPIFDRACADCHQRDGAATATLDLTLRPDEMGEKRWGGIFPEPYLTLLMGKDNDLTRNLTFVAIFRLSGGDVPPTHFATISIRPSRSGMEAIVGSHRRRFWSWAAIRHGDS